MTKPRVVAEAGVNHNGSLDRALLMIDEAAEAGADTVKFQTFDPTELVSAAARKAEYQEKQTGSGTQREMLEALALDEAAHVELVKRCQERGISFLSTPFDVTSVEELAALGVREYKIASGEITDLPVLRAVARHADSVLLSTGMATIDEISQALEALKEAGLDRECVTLLHCTTEYPAPVEEVNLLAMEEMCSLFCLPVGYSDHTEGIEISIAAAAMGAAVIEKHFTLDRTLPGPDHAASIEPAELRALVRAIGRVSLARGAAAKHPMPSEIHNAPLVRKSIVAARAIEAGETFTEENITAKRPGTGLSPMLWDSVVGLAARRRFEADEAIEL
ncbi:MAG: N-acetylneuraminate synthase [Actinobacteria bacterium]|nr:N-acetylneuraminate synthase [Actinomycetota bacterium]